MEMLSYNPTSDLAWTAAYVVVVALVLYVGRELTRFLRRDGRARPSPSAPVEPS